MCVSRSINDDKEWEWHPGRATNWLKGFETTVCDCASHYILHGSGIPSASSWSFENRDQHCCRSSLSNRRLPAAQESSFLFHWQDGASTSPVLSVWLKNCWLLHTFFPSQFGILSRDVCNSVEATFKPCVSTESSTAPVARCYCREVLDVGIASMESAVRLGRMHSQ